MKAKEEGKTGIILGWQNVTGIEDQIGYLGLFKELGIGIIQLAYNTQNLVGTGCYESKDGGLSDFGREVVAEMNRLGILCDLSHVGAKTSEDVILASEQPVAYSHCLPAGLKAHPRNKSDEQLKFIVDHGGFVGVTMFPPSSSGAAAHVDDYVEAIDYVVNICGEDSVGVGTDFTQGYGQPFFDWITHDKGYARRLTDFGESSTRRVAHHRRMAEPDRRHAAPRLDVRPHRRCHRAQLAEPAAHRLGRLTDGQAAGRHPGRRCDRPLVGRRAADDPVLPPTTTMRSRRSSGQKLEEVLRSAGRRSPYFWCEEAAHHHGMSGVGVPPLPAADHPAGLGPTSRACFSRHFGPGPRI